jgi:hypothetical protein
MNICKERLKNTERAIKSCHPRETENIGYTRGKQKHNTICIGHCYSEKITTNSVNKTCSLLQTTGGKDESNIVLMRKTDRFFIHSP